MYVCMYVYVSVMCLQMVIAHLATHFHTSWGKKPLAQVQIAENVQKDGVSAKWSERVRARLALLRGGQLPKKRLKPLWKPKERRVIFN